MTELRLPPSLPYFFSFLVIELSLFYLNAHLLLEVRPIGGRVKMSFLLYNGGIKNMIHLTNYPCLSKLATLLAPFFFFFKLTDKTINSLGHAKPWPPFVLIPSLLQ